MSNNHINEVSVRMSFITIPYDSKNAAKEFIIEQIYDVIYKSPNHDLIQIVFFFTRKLRNRINNIDVFFHKILEKIPDEKQLILFREDLPINHKNGLQSNYSDEIIKKYKSLNDAYFKSNNTK